MNFPRLVGMSTERVEISTCYERVTPQSVLVSPAPILFRFFNGESGCRNYNCPGRWVANPNSGQARREASGVRNCAGNAGRQQHLGRLGHFPAVVSRRTTYRGIPNSAADPGYLLTSMLCSPAGTSKITWPWRTCTFFAGRLSIFKLSSPELNSELVTRTAWSPFNMNDRCAPSA